MWSYARLSKIAKKFGGPAAYSLTLFGAGGAMGYLIGNRHEIREKVATLLQKGSEDVPIKEDSSSDETDFTE